jgi:hypothetical protein
MTTGCPPAHHAATYDPEKLLSHARRYATKRARLSMMAIVAPARRRVRTRSPIIAIAPMVTFIATA